MKAQIETIVKYEFISLESGKLYPIVKVLNYFGVDTICKAYGCPISNTIAQELVRMEFQKLANK